MNQGLVANVYFRLELTDEARARPACSEKVAKPVIQATLADVWQCLWHVATRWASILCIFCLTIIIFAFIIIIASQCLASLLLQGVYLDTSSRSALNRLVRRSEIKSAFRASNIRIYFFRISIMSNARVAHLSSYTTH